MAKDINEILGIIAKFAIGFSILAYMAGIVIVNLYLSQFGYYSFDLLRLSYVTAGMWFLYIALLGDAAHIALRGSVNWLRSYRSGNTHIEWRMSSWNWKGVSDEFFGFFGTLYLMSIPLIYFSDIQFDLYFAGLIIVLIFAYASWEFWFKELFYKEDGNAIYPIIAGLFLVLACLNIFAKNIYGDIPINIGGGKSITVDIAVETKTREILKSLGVAIEEETSSITLELLSANSQDYVFLLEGCKCVINVKRDLIKGIRYGDKARN